MADGMLSLSWNNHSTTFCHMLTNLRQKEKYTDATLACEGKFYPVHKLVLSTCSQYFEDMFEHTLGKHPVVLLQDVRCDELEALLSYMYAGIVSVAQRDLTRLIKVAELMQVKGLAVPDEIPASKKASVNNHNASKVKSTSQSKMSQGADSSDDRASPHPKRQRREGNGSSFQGRAAPNTTSDSPTYCRDENRIQESVQNNYHVQEQPDEVHQRLEDVDWSGSIQGQQTDTDTDPAAQQRLKQEVDQGLHNQSESQEPSTAQYNRDGGEDAVIIKEENWEDPEDNQNKTLNNLGYGPVTEESLAGVVEGTQDESAKMMLPKEYDSSGQPGQPSQGLPEVVVEALAGPSSMHEWLGGGDFAAGLIGVENYGGEGSSPTSDALQHQMAGEETCGLGGASVTRPSHLKLHQCSYCSYSTPRKDHLVMHVRTHTGEKPYACPYCPSRFVQRGTLSNHIRTHTGEKPFACPICPQSFARNSHLRSHMLTHKGYVPVSTS